MQFKKSSKTIIPINLLIFALVTIVTNACKKNNIDISQPVEDDKPIIKLVRSIEFDDGVTASMKYNADSTLNEITYRFGNVLSSTIFNWENLRLKEYYNDRSLYKNTLFHNESGISYSINSYKNVQLLSSYKMGYSYNAKGQVTALKFYTTNESGTTLKATSTYYYNNISVLEKVETKENNAVYTHLIESYSDSVYFNPLLFIETVVSENYPIYNIPVLSSMKRYPAKIIRKVKLGNEATYIDKILENTVSIEDKNISQITSRLTIPGMPSYNRGIVSVFKY